MDNNWHAKGMRDGMIDGVLYGPGLLTFKSTLPPGIYKDGYAVGLTVGLKLFKERRAGE
jgi:hypothetical protein